MRLLHEAGWQWLLPPCPSRRRSHAGSLQPWAPPLPPPPPPPPPPLPPHSLCGPSVRCSGVSRPVRRSALRTSSSRSTAHSAAARRGPSRPSPSGPPISTSSRPAYTCRGGRVRLCGGGCGVGMARAFHFITRLLARLFASSLSLLGATEAAWQASAPTACAPPPCRPSRPPSPLLPSGPHLLPQLLLRLLPRRLEEALQRRAVAGPVPVHHHRQQPPGGLARRLQLGLRKGRCGGRCGCGVRIS